MPQRPAAQAEIGAVEIHLPAYCLGNDQLAEEYPDWSVEKIQGKTGIRDRWIAADGECASDLGTNAAEQLFASGACRAKDVDYLLFCTQSPDYFLPTTACVMQNRLGLPTTAGALDFNLGCSGFIYGLGLAKGLIETEQAETLLLITAETYSKHIHPKDRSVRTLFSDGAAATLIRRRNGGSGGLLSGPFLYGTDGRGAENLIVPTGGMRAREIGPDEVEQVDDDGNLRSRNNLFMNGPEIFSFTISAVPKAVQGLLQKSGKTIEDIDLFIFHQANQYMLEHLRKKIRIPAEKFVICLEKYGNTVSSTIPIALRESLAAGHVKPGSTVMLVGFGVGYSWGATLVQW